MAVFGVDSAAYRAKTMGFGAHQNGAYHYAREIERYIVPAVETDRDWVLINTPGHCWDGAIVFVHNNKKAELYSWLSKYSDLILVCGIPETVAKVSHLGQAIYLPLSVDVPYVEKFRRPKTKDVCYVGRRSKTRDAPVPKGIDYVCGLDRKHLLQTLAQYERAYAVGRCAIESRILGCEVLPFDPRFPDPERWKVLDSRDAAGILQRQLDQIDG